MCPHLRPAATIALIAAITFALSPTSSGQGDDAVPSAAVPIETAVRAGIERLVRMQEGDNHAEWPYEGVYRVRDAGTRSAVIPIGYRVGGTSICALAVMHAPDFANERDHREAVDRAAAFVVDAIRNPRMNFENIRATYDVRGWGYTYGALFLLDYRELADNAPREAIDEAIRFYINGINATEIPESGGWNYARPGGFDRPGPMSPFMTAPTLQTLFKAEEAGFVVHRSVIARGLDALERARLDSGAFVYTGEGSGRNARSQVPGAIARMSVAESTLFLAGRSSVDRIRGAVDAFIVHWDWLDKRRAQNGTHVPPYGIAPYYFYFGHYYASQAVELLPEQDRAEYRRRLRELLMRNRLASGTWNDRVFERSANYGTAMAVLSLRMPELSMIPAWSPAQAQ